MLWELLMPTYYILYLLEYLTVIIFYEFVILKILRVINFTILSLLVYFVCFYLMVYEPDTLIGTSQRGKLPWYFLFSIICPI